MRYKTIKIPEWAYQDLLICQKEILRVGADKLPPMARELLKGMDLCKVGHTVGFLAAYLHLALLKGGHTTVHWNCNARDGRYHIWLNGVHIYSTRDQKAFDCALKRFEALKEK